jgi:predicted transcriptional regulator
MSNVVTARIDDETLALIDRLATEYDRSRAWVLAKLIAENAKREAAFLDFLQEGEDAFDRGDTISHEQLIANIEARYNRGQIAA